MGIARNELRHESFKSIATGRKLAAVHSGGGNGDDDFNQRASREGIMPAANGPD